MRRTQNFQTIAWFWDLHNRGLLDMDPPYQRRSVWNQKYKDYFVDTILINYPAPAIFLFENMSPDGRVTYAVVDGKQRLTTIFEFIKDTFPLSVEAEKTNLRGKYFKDLEDEVKRGFWSYTFMIENLPSDDEHIINDIFDRLNRNSARLTPQELRHARFDGKFIEKVEENTDWLFTELPEGFPYLVKKSRWQMKDVEFVALLFLLLEMGPQGYTSDQLDKAFSDRDTDWEEEDRVIKLFQQTVHVLKDLHNSFSKHVKGRFKNQADFYSLFGAIAEVLEAEEKAYDIESWAKRLEEFVSVWADEERREKNHAASQYETHLRAGSDTTKARKERITILIRVLRGEWTSK
jgi:hypothetical protein